jgi:hypothetical protein
MPGEAGCGSKVSWPCMVSIRTVRAARIGSTRPPATTPKLRVKVLDQNTDPDGGVCQQCYNGHGSRLQLTDEWTTTHQQVM